MDELDPAAQPPKSQAPVWTFYGPGWRREAYRLYEEGVVCGSDQGLSLMGTNETAIRIEQLIEPHAGRYEILRCDVSHPDAAIRPERAPNWSELGFDLAYPGGLLLSNSQRLA